MGTLGILADDFTGANDTGVQFAKRGISTVTVLKPEAAGFDLSHDAEVMVVNTETRNLPGSAAYSRVQQAAVMLLEMGVPFLYKKVDSTLRGYPATELLATMRAKQVTVGVMAPSFPATGRMVAGGCLFVTEGPSKQTFAEGLNILQLVSEQARCQAGLLSLANVRTGVGCVRQFLAEVIRKQEETIIVADAASQEDLAVIARAAQDLLSELVLAGSAGLAAELSYVKSISVSEQGTNKRDATAAQAGPVLMIIGSYNPATAKQIAWLAEHRLASIIALDVTKLVSGADRPEIERVTSLAKSSLAAGRHTAIILNTLNESVGQMQPFEQLFKKDKDLILQALGQIARTIFGSGDANADEIADAYTVGALFLSGGDTAAYVCESLGCQAIILADEILPGIPVGRLLGNQSRDLYAVTKSGGFGAPDALAEVLRYIERWVKSSVL